MNYYKELYHWGTKGMKWGIRRYQNGDGTLTEAGKECYRKDDPVKSFMSSNMDRPISVFNSYDYSSLVKVNQDLLNKSIDDILKGLKRS